jgi:hypothetical protein
MSNGKKQEKRKTIEDYTNKDQWPFGFCPTCRYIDPFDDGLDAGGQCRFYPPAPRWIDEHVHKYVDEDPTAEWPFVTPHDWCGKYEVFPPVPPGEKV